MKLSKKEKWGYSIGYVLYMFVIFFLAIPKQKFVNYIIPFLVVSAVYFVIAWFGRKKLWGPKVQKQHD